ncbi:MAG: flagellin [Verrucomicrobia subdivision 3 bacterium]|nr:flagellin [Limisphaerales bacterium]
MRVATNSFADSLVNQLGRLSVRQQQLQTQAATGQRIQSPSDDPVALRRVLDLQAESSTVGQYERNIARQQELAEATYSGIKSIKTVSDRASEIATLADGLSSPQELQAYAAEINQLIKQAAQVMNTTNRGDSLFGGTRLDQPAFIVATDANDRVTSVTFQGNASLSEVEIAQGSTITAQAVGANTSGSGPRGLITDSRSGADLFAHLISLQNNLLAGDTAAIAATDSGNLRNDEDNILFHVSSNGATQARLEAANAMAGDRTLSLEKSVSAEADADIAQTLVKLSQTQTAYQAALQSGATILKVSLLDYLR